MQSPNPTGIVLLIALPLIAWRVYSRVRRMVGRQRLSKVRPWITLAIFPALIVLLAIVSLAHLELLGLLVAGLAGGMLLAQYGLRKTVFEATPQGLFYTPNAHLGIALSLLFIGRILYRFIEIYFIGSVAAEGVPDFGRSPLTLGIFGLLAGYYIAYAVGLLQWRFRVSRAARDDGGAT
jgi:hypothetical protein